MVIPSSQTKTRKYRRCITDQYLGVAGAIMTLALFFWIPWFGVYNEDSALISSSSALSTLLEETGVAINDTLRTGSVIGSRHPKSQDNSGFAPMSFSGRVSNTSSIYVVQEENVSRGYSNQTNFVATFFESAPSCTPLSEDQVDFTLVTQASIDRLWIMKYHCERWPSPLPISLAVYLPQNSKLDEHDVAQELGVKLSCDLSRLKVIVLKRNSPVEAYPVNLLRNLAIRAATTSHVMYTDSDFLISAGLHDDLVAMAPTIASDPLAAVVVPAFKYNTACPEFFSSKNVDTSACLAQEVETNVPMTKQDLLRLWKKPKRRKPNAKQGFHGVHFHGSTLYDVYKNQTEPLPIPCISNYLYEPYLAVRLCRDLPEFPEVFRGYGWNKNIWILWLTQKLAYQLWQIPRGFVIHLPHDPSASKRMLDQDGDGKKSNGFPPEYDRYFNWFKYQIPLHPNRMPYCSGTKK